MNNTANLPDSVRNPVMMLITKAEMKKLRDNNAKVVAGESVRPVVKLFVGRLTWLVTDIDDDGILFGYADMGYGEVEFGSLCHVAELPGLRGGLRAGLRASACYLERDRFFTDKPDVNYFDLDTLVGV
jgi:hypothetical protein